MATARVILDQSQYVRCNIGYTSMLLEAHRDDVRIVLADSKPAYSNTSYHLLGGDDAALQLPVVDTNVWALAMSAESSLIVTEASHIAKTAVTDIDIGRSVEVNHKGHMVVDDVTRIAGSLFETNTKATEIWREAVTAAATVTQSKGEILMSTGVTADGSAIYHTVEKGRFIAGTINVFRFVGFLVDAPVADNERRVGAGVFANYTPAGNADPTDGYGMYVNGTEFGFWYRSLSSNPTGIVRIPSGSFSTGKTFVPSVTDVIEFECEYDHAGVYYFIDEELYHFQPASIDMLSDTFNLHAFVQNVNRNGSTTNVRFMAHVAVIHRYGKDETTPITRRVSPGVAPVTTVLKTGPGSLHTVINAIRVVASSVTVWDGVTGAAPSRQILTIDAANFQGALPFDAPFRDGLTVVTDKPANDLTFIYE